MSEKQQEVAKNNKKENYIKIASGLVIIIMIAVVIVLLTYQKNTTITIEKEPKSYGYISCTRNLQNENDIIFSPKAISVEESLKVSFTDDQIFDISFVFKGEYPDEQTASGASATMLADLDKYMSKTDGNRSLYNPHNSNVGTSAQFSVYTKRSNISESSKGIFFFSSNDNPQLINQENLKKIYESKGFLCGISE